MFQFNQLFSIFDASSDLRTITKCKVRILFCFNSSWMTAAALTVQLFKGTSHTADDALLSRKREMIFQKKKCCCHISGREYKQQEKKK